jgi:hypothetical protein
MANSEDIWKHELDWLNYLQKCYTASSASWEQDSFKRQIEKSLDFLKQEVFFGGLCWIHENGVLRCSSSSTDKERLVYLIEILESFPIVRKIL